MEPFSVSLGIAEEAFQPWRQLLFRSTEGVLLVEGATDQEYFELLRREEHGNKRLTFSGEIFAYGGCGTLKNQALLRFIKNRFAKVFVTFDLDVAGIVEGSLQTLGFERRTSYLPIGVNHPGKRSIEGLLPDRVHNAVYAANRELVQALQSDNKNERQSARSNLKVLLLDEFKKVAVPGEDYDKLYELSKVINRALEAS